MTPLFRQTLFVLFLTGWGTLSGAFAAAPIPVFVTIAPQANVVKRIGGDRVEVQVLVEPGADPHTYEPKPRQMAELSRAALYFAIGIEMEKARLDKITRMNPELTIIHTDQDVLKPPMEGQLHKASDSAAHTGYASGDPHIWLSPPLVMFQARTILMALQSADPKYRADYETRYQSFMGATLELDSRLRSQLAGKQGAPFMVFHPSWGAFAHAYGLKQIAIEVEGKSPKPAQLSAMIQKARNQNIRVVFVQPQFSAKSAREIAKAIDGQVVAADPLAMDWDAELLKIAGEIAHAGK